MQQQDFLPAVAFRMPGSFERPDVLEQQAKRHQPMQVQLPAPLTEQVLSQAMRELNQGTARAVESCLQCYRGKRMSGDDLLSFTRSIAMHSATLSDVFRRKQASQCDMGEAAGADDFAALMALSGGSAPAPSLAPRMAVYSLHVPAPPSIPAINPMPAISIDAIHVPSTKLVVPRTRKAKVSEPSDEELRLMQWWREKRVTEIARRQHETAKCNNALQSSAERNGAYVRFLMGKVMTALPTVGNLKLLEHVRTFNSTEDITAFSENVKNLVDEFDVKISLNYPLECTVRSAPAPNARAVAAAARQAAAEAAAVASIDIDGDFEMDGSWPSVQTESTPAHAASGHSHCQTGCSHDSSSSGKRKRTETLNGAHPEDEDDMACCPVCQDEPREDDRWVKCDGCGSWYHQICVLFNEIAHGKSVRFFCRTPGCRKRGSRQLNRRQRKPCYPTSPNIESSALANAMTAMVQPVARGDRNVVIKMVANVESVREIKGSRTCRKSVERCRKKTICAFQHTLIGSDLLFMVMFVEEIVSPDGVGRVEIRKVDVNGFYEELQHNEAVNVEKAVIQSYLGHAANAGFGSVRIHVGGQKRSLFLGAPSSLSTTASVDSCMNVLEEARNLGVVYSFQQERCDGSEEAVRVQLQAPGCVSTVAIERDADIACPVAQTSQDWMQVQEQHGYKFDDLQFAKFSSMMMVYHMIKGWKKEFTAPPRQIAAPCSETDTPPPPRTYKAMTPSDSDPGSPVPAYEDAPAMAPAYEMPAYEDAPSMAVPVPEPNLQFNGMGGNAFSERQTFSDAQAGQLPAFDNLPYDVRAMLQMQVEPLGARGGYVDDGERLQQPAFTGMTASNSNGDLQLMRHSSSFEDLRGGAGCMRASTSVEDLRAVQGLRHSGSVENMQGNTGLMRGSSVEDLWADSLVFGEHQQQPKAEEPFWDCFFSSL